MVFSFLWNSLYSPKAHVSSPNCKMSVAQQAALAQVLDEQDILPHADEQNDEKSNTQKLFEEHTARVRAEAEAQDRGNRLRVAQEQLAEYAAQKAGDAERLAQEALACSSAVGQALQTGDLAGAGALMTQLHALQQAITEAAEEARAFAVQQRADVDSLKRSYAQAELPSSNGDVEMKRARETGCSEDEGSMRSTSPASAGPSTSARAEGMTNGHDGEGGDQGSSDDADDDAQEEASGSRRRQSNGNAASANGASHTSFLERAKYIPIRLSFDERRLLRLLEAALNVSDYTGQVDIQTYRNKTGRMHAQIKDICSILSGLYVAHDYRRGQALVKDREFAENAEWFQTIFELGRRYKVLNPDKMRSEYGKLMYLLMDSANPDVQELLGFQCVIPLKTVHSVLAAKNALRVLEDPHLHVATAEIIAGSRPRYEIQRDLKAKEKAREGIAKRHSGRGTGLTEQEVLDCIYSISDNNAFLLFNRDPIDRMIGWFTEAFKPREIQKGWSLAISSGCEGARLTHNHERQYNYVLQSLTLWREISTEMFKLWYLSESDMLRTGNFYRLVDTGQGLNRVQAAPSVSSAIHKIIQRCQAKIGGWVGSSVVHLGDHNVPNALIFTDKYCQVPRILNPVVLVLEELPRLYNARDNKHLADCIDNMFGSLLDCQKSILADFCRHAFDGSGADNFFDAGSCIDGRLTSAWNWCSKLEKKPYYLVFKLAGFVGFDGDFKG